MTAPIQNLPFPHLRAYKTGDAVIMTVDSYTYGDGFYVFHENEGSCLRIGKYSSIARETCFFNGQEHNLDWGTTYPFQRFPLEWEELRVLQGHPRSRGDINVGSDVWIGYGSLIRSGVTIGDGAVVGMGSVVTKDIPPYAIAAGNPARVVRQRFAPEVVAELLKLAWWNQPQELVRRIAPLLCQPLDMQVIEDIKSAMGSTTASEQPL